MNSKDSMSGNAKRFRLSREYDKNNYEMRYTLSRLLSTVLHRSDRLGDMEYRGFEEKGMFLGDGGFIVLGFSVGLQRGASRYHSLNPVRVRDAMYADLEQIVRNELYYYCISYISEVNGELTALTCFPRVDISYVNQIFSQLEKCCRQIIKKAGEIGITCQVYLSNLVNGYSKISQAHKQMQDLLALSRFWPEMGFTHFNISAPYKKERHYKILSLQFEAAARFYAYALRGDKGGAVATAMDMLRNIRTTPPLSPRKMITEMRCFFDLALHGSSHQELISIGSLGAIRHEHRLTNASGMAQLEEVVRDIADFFVDSLNRYGSRSAAVRAVAAQDYIRENISNAGLTVARVAEEFSISQPLLSSQFKKYTGENVSDFISKCRVEYAKGLLKKTILPLEAVCEKSGFGSLTTMHRAFRRHESLSPGKYRDGARQTL